VSTPGIAHFGGLGELKADQLSRLPDMAATQLTATALEHATRAWAAFRASDPAGLREIAATPSRELRFLAEAFDRLSCEYPSTRDGLSLTERRILAAVAEGAPTAEAAFVRVGARERRPFLGDTWCFDAMTRLARAPSPLLEVEPTASPVGPHSHLRLTDVGQRVLDGHADHITLNGIDRWIGGVHLTGHNVAWRWHEGKETITTQTSVYSTFTTPSSGSP
jgi:DNA-binding transcriptional LysR family regulator